MASSVENVLEIKGQRQELSYTKLNELRNDAKLCDVTLKTTDGDELHAHKCVLVSNSEYFEKMFTGGFKETDQKIICIKDISNDILRRLIDFIYTGILVTIDEDNVEGLLNGADILQMTDVIDLCAKYYLRTIDDENCFIIKDIADSRMMKKLSAECMEYIITHFDSVSQSAAFLNTNIKQIIEILKHFNAKKPGEIAEIRFEAIIKWVKHNETDRIDSLLQLLYLLQLTCLSNSYVYQNVVTEPLIKSNPKYMEFMKKQFKHLCLDDPLPTQLRTMKRKPASIRSIRLPRIMTKNPQSPCYGEIAIDLFALFDGKVSEFKSSEWSILMNEDNFLKEWHEEWEDAIE